MIEKELLLNDLQKQLHDTEDETKQIVLRNIIADILSNKYSVRIW